MIQKVTWTRRQRADGRGLRLPVPRRSDREQDVHVRASARRTRTGRSSTGTGRRVFGHSRADDRGEGLARRWRQLDPGDRRARGRRNRRSLVGLARPRQAEGGSWHERTRAEADRTRRGRGRGAGRARRCLGACGAAADVAVCERGRQQLARAGRRSPTARRSSLGSRSSPSPMRPAGSRRPARPRRSAQNPNRLDVPLDHLAQGWYLVYWRVISVDGHPVRGAFTFAVGPNPGPAPQFVIPSISETAATPRPARPPAGSSSCRRWSPSGCSSFARLIARPVRRRVPGSSLRAVTIAFSLSLAARPRRNPDLPVAGDGEIRAARRLGRLGALLPLMRASAFGRGFLTLELVLALFAVAGAADAPRRASGAAPTPGFRAPRGDRCPAGRRRPRSLIPGIAGHAAQTSPRVLSIAFDWVHLMCGAVWIGGLIGLIVLWIGLDKIARLPGYSVCVPRFSRVAFVSVMLLIGSGTGASVMHLPTLASLWQTSYGKAILVKVALLGVAMLLASVNLARNTPRLQAATDAPTRQCVPRCCCAGSCPARSCSWSAAILAAAVLSSLPPPPKALARHRHRRFARRPRRGDRDRAAGRLPARHTRRAEPGRSPERLLRRDQQERIARTPRRRDRNVHHAGHGDGPACVPPARDCPRPVRARGSCARHGRALGPCVRDQAPKAERRSPSSS